MIVEERKEIAAAITAQRIFRGDRLALFGCHRDHRIAAVFRDRHASFVTGAVAASPLPGT
ncbi:hypothetical protein QWZ10_20200 [Paracoccus cavernae]|uniref:Uncharacterized protein n=1 Tax=Paracoccus cavernae TaxID=1571207 RepID=A0ABT8D9N0_9RHOB|nr:hypothetical protein [Paracoccus cavernae]